MSDIALYEALTKLGLDPNEAREAVAEVANSKEMATKSDIKEIRTELKTELKYLRWFFFFGFSVLLAAIKFL